MATQTVFYYEINHIKPSGKHEWTLWNTVRTQVLAFGVMVTLYFYYIFWAFNCVRGFVTYQQKIVSLYEILFHQDQVKMPEIGEAELV
jgi:hypothetical protein